MKTEVKRERVLRTGYAVLYTNPENLITISNIYIYVCVCVCVCSVTQSCPTLCDPVDHRPPRSSVHRIL